MLKKLTASAVIVLTIFTSQVPSAFAAARSAQDPVTVQKIRKKITATKPKTVLNITLNDRTKLKGYVSGATENDFVLVDKKGTTIRTIVYSDIHSAGQPFLKGPLIVGAGMAATLIIVFGVLGAGCGCR